MSYKRWVNEEIEFLIENYAKLGIQKCSEGLNRSPHSVFWKARTLDLSVPSELHGERIRQYKLGKPRSESTRHKLSEAKRGKPAPNKIPREKLIQKLLDLAYVLDRSPKSSEVRALAGITTVPFLREFGSWRNALATAGLPPPPKQDGIESFEAVTLRPCEVCGQEMEISHWWPDRRFCKRACFGMWLAQNNTGEQNPHWKGGSIPYYGPNWRKQRRCARKRDNYACQRCGVTEQELGRELDVHHIKAFRDCQDYREANRLENLISLCPIHHKQLEGQPLGIIKSTRPVS